MKKIHLLIFGLLLANTQTFAKNAFDGPYVGVGVALGIGHNDFSQTTRTTNGMKLSDSSSRLSPVGVLGGVHAGWNRALSEKYVIGLEIWGDASTLDESLKETNGELADMSSKDEMRWSIGAALKGGVVIGDGLAYISLGWVGSEWKTKTTVTGFDPAGPSTSRGFSNSKFLNGFRPALGYTFDLNKRLQISGEAAYTFYEQHKNSNPFSFGGVNTTVRTKSRPEIAELRLKLSWKLFS